MAFDNAVQKYDDLALELVNENDGVTAAAEGLLVHGTIFAFRMEEYLVVDVPSARADDLVERGIAAHHEQSGRSWVRVATLELWPELAREAREFVAVPGVGGQS